VARGLAERGVEQRLVVRDSAGAPTLEHAEVAEASDYPDADAMRAALDGIDTLYLVSAGEHPDRVSLHPSTVDTATAAERIVYVSFLGAAPEATFTFARDHFHTEQHIRQSGLGFTFLRSSILHGLPAAVRFVWRDPGSGRKRKGRGGRSQRPGRRCGGGPAGARRARRPQL
jgi:NAD(P)H dehydrogenase (quinone)